MKHNPNAVRVKQVRVQDVELRLREAARILLPGTDQKSPRHDGAGGKDVGNDNAFYKPE